MQRTLTHTDTPQTTPWKADIGQENAANTETQTPWMTAWHGSQRNWSWGGGGAAQEHCAAHVNITGSHTQGNTRYLWVADTADFLQKYSVVIRNMQVWAHQNVVSMTGSTMTLEFYLFVCLFVFTLVLQLFYLLPHNLLYLGVWCHLAEYQCYW